MLANQLAKGGFGLQLALGAEHTEPFVAQADMAYFVAQDDAEQAHGLMVADSGQLLLNRWRGIEATCFEQAWNQRHARKRVGCRTFRHMPQAVVYREVAVIMAKRQQMLAQHAEMRGLFNRDIQPVGVIGGRKAGKAQRMVEREIDRRELDMGNGMQQGRPTFARVWFALWNRSRFHSLGPYRYAAFRNALMCEKWLKSRRWRDGGI